MKQDNSGFAPSISLHLPINDFFNYSGLKWTLQTLEKSDHFDNKIVAKHQVFASETSEM